MHYCTTVRFQEDTFNTPMFEHCINEHGGINDDGQRTQQVFFLFVHAFVAVQRFGHVFNIPHTPTPNAPPPLFLSPAHACNNYCSSTFGTHSTTFTASPRTQTMPPRRRVYTPGLSKAKPDITRPFTRGPSLPSSACQAWRLGPSFLGVSRTPKMTVF